MSWPYGIMDVEKNDRKSLRPVTTLVTTYERKEGRIMRFLEKFRRIMAADKTASRRDKAGLMGNSLWDGVYDRSGTPKDSRGAINKEELRRDRGR